MDSQPYNFSEDTSTNGYDGIDRICFDAFDLRSTIDDLALGEGATTLNTPTRSISNPWATPSALTVDSQESHDLAAMTLQELISTAFHQELPVLREDISDVLEYPIFGLTEQSTNTNEQEAIAAIANDLRNAADEHSHEVDLQAIIWAMNRLGTLIMRMYQEPITRHRFRYRSDGVRYLEQSRQNPMAITLPNLNGCLVRPYQSFWVQLTIVTTWDNPSRKVFVHQHEMCYTGENAEQNGLHCFRIPLAEEDIRRQMKEFRHLSIIKTKLKDYVFELTPFDPLVTDDHPYDYTVSDEDTITKVQKAKRFDQQYHTENYHIVCQLMIKQRDRWYTTDLHCQTHVITDD